MRALDLYMWLKENARSDANKEIKISHSITVVGLFISCMSPFYNGMVHGNKYGPVYLFTNSGHIFGPPYYYN